MSAKSLNSELDINIAGIIDVGIIVVAHFNPRIKREKPAFAPQNC